MTRTMTTLQQDLLDFGDLKVWSVLVTLLGDLASEPGAQVSGPMLRALMDRINIKPEALRVALHRLRKDGWISATREGRISHYGMTDHARTETEKVRALVYDRQVGMPKQWYLVAAPTDQNRGLMLQRALWITDTPPSGEPTALTAHIETDPIPDWVIDQILTPELRRSCATLATLLKNGDVDGMDELDGYAIRLLALHHWRRLVLKQTPMAIAFLSQIPEIAGYRATITDFLTRIALPGQGC